MSISQAGALLDTFIPANGILLERHANDLLRTTLSKSPFLALATVRKLRGASSDVSVIDTTLEVSTDLLSNEDTAIALLDLMASALAARLEDLVRNHKLGWPAVLEIDPIIRLSLVADRPTWSHKLRLIIRARVSPE